MLFSFLKESWFFLWIKWVHSLLLNVRYIWNVGPRTVVSCQFHEIGRIVIVYHCVGSALKGGAYGIWCSWTAIGRALRRYFFMKNFKCQWECLVASILFDGSQESNVFGDAEGPSNCRCVVLHLINWYTASDSNGSRCQTWSTFTIVIFIRIVHQSNRVAMPFVILLPPSFEAIPTKKRRSISTTRWDT